MAEEFQGGVSCGGNWWNQLPKNLFASSPCSLVTNDPASFDWPDHDTIVTDAKGAKSSDDSSAAFSSSRSLDDRNQDFFREIEPPLDSSIITGEFFNGNYSLQQPPSNPTPASAGIFPMDSDTSSFLQTLFDTDDSDQPAQQPLFAVHNDYLNYDQLINNTYKNLNESFLPTFPVTSPMLRPPFANQHNYIPFTNTPSTTQPHMFLPSSLSSINPRNPVGLKQSGSEPAVKRARIQTPSSLPTFKVRKEKLGDRVTALQQLVSPFGKTDTASVLHEAVEYIKFLHDQVTVLSTPYLKKGSSPPVQNQLGEEAGVQQDLISRGLCLVPISSTFPVTAETTTDFWTPIFGESFK